MVESISDAVQLAVLAVCLTLALVRAARSRSAAWVTAACFFACMLLGGAYWLGYQLVFGDIPHYSYIAEMSWVAGYVFLLMLAVEADRARGVVAPVPAAWVPVAVCAACCAFFIADSGSVLLNLADNGLMAAIGFFAVRGIAAKAPEGGPVAGIAGSRAFHWALLAFIVVEEALWLSSCLAGPSLASAVNPYVMLNCALTLVYAAILAVAWRPDAA